MTDDALAPVVASVRPVPPPEVMAAVVAAVDQLWPRPVIVETPQSRTPMWRFSGRWWAKPTAMRRDRPWMGGTR